ncbi:MAG TPA: sulfite exporter TauE/SafE family protein [Actinomycetota bacterium]|nr:sulfite exporter TauE/SafE family protein [Actinomycetota bacterium]
MVTALSYVAVILGSAVQAATGLGFALVAGPFLIAVNGHSEAIRTIMVQSSILNLLVLAREWRGVELKPLSPLLIGGLVAVAPVAFIIRNANTYVLAIVAGVITLVAAVVLASGVRIKLLRGAAPGVATGAISATTGLLAGIGGPPVAMYAINSGWKPAMYRPALQVFFLILNFAGLALLGLPESNQLLCAAVLIVGWLAGTVFARKLNERSLVMAALTVAAAGGIFAAAQGLVKLLG